MFICTVYDYDFTFNIKAISFFREFLPIVTKTPGYLQKPEARGIVGQTSAFFKLLYTESRAHHKALISWYSNFPFGIAFIRQCEWHLAVNTANNWSQGNLISLCFDMIFECEKYRCSCFTYITASEVCALEGLEWVHMYCIWLWLHV